MIEPTLAIVRPRVIGSDGTARPLEDVIDVLLSRGDREAYVLVGPRGSGKSTALRHLAATLELQSTLGTHCQLVDSDDWFSSYGSEVDGASVLTLTAARSTSPEFARTLTLARWDRDELAEYLLSPTMRTRTLSCRRWRTLWNLPNTSGLSQWNLFSACWRVSTSLNSFE